MLSQAVNPGQLGDGVDVRAEENDQGAASGHHPGPLGTLVAASVAAAA
jgi:hypothetical protein